MAKTMYLCGFSANIHWFDEYYAEQYEMKFEIEWSIQCEGPEFSHFPAKKLYSGQVSINGPGDIFCPIPNVPWPRCWPPLGGYTLIVTIGGITKIIPILLADLPFDGPHKAPNGPFVGNAVGGPSISFEAPAKVGSLTKSFLVSVGAWVGCGALRSLLKPMVVLLDANYSEREAALLSVSCDYIPQDDYIQPPILPAAVVPGSAAAVDFNKMAQDFLTHPGYMDVGPNAALIWTQHQSAIQVAQFLEANFPKLPVVVLGLAASAGVFQSSTFLTYTAVKDYFTGKPWLWEVPE